MVYNIDGHTVEIRYSSSGSIDPWSGDYAREIGVSQWGTADIANFALVDGDTIYRFRGSGSRKFEHYFENHVFDEPGMFELWLEEMTDRKFGSLKELKAILDERKKRNDEYEAMTPEEKEEYKRKWREERDKRFAEINKKNEEI